jgi:hypothetical protein
MHLIDKSKAPSFFAPAYFDKLNQLNEDAPFFGNYVLESAIMATAKMASSQP